MVTSRTVATDLDSAGQEGNNQENVERAGGVVRASTNLRG
jgi:hypothetical protein